MSKDKHKKQLNRQAFLNRLKEKISVQEDQVTLSEFSQRALQGTQYLPDGMDLSEALHRIDQKIDRKTRSRRRNMPFLLKIAAGLLLVVSVAYFLLMRSPNPQKLFSQSFQALPSAIPQSGIDRGTSESLLPHLKALALYEAEKYQEAIPLFESHLANQEGDFKIRFYYSISLLANYKAGTAIEEFAKVIATSNNTAYQRSAKWYQALGYLLINQKQKAQINLEELIQQEGDFNQEAKDLLSKF